MNVILPVSPEVACQVKFVRLDDAWSSVDIRLLNPRADLLLRYLQSGDLSQAWTTAEPLQAQQLLREKVADPVEATVEAYALLRFRREDFLRDWPSNLLTICPLLPDGLAIRCEQLAREGTNAEALGLFNQLPSRALPIFSVGLSYAIDRLRLYLGTRSFASRYSLDPRR